MNLAEKVASLGGTLTPFKQRDYLNGQMLGKDGICDALSAFFLASYRRGDSIVRFFDHLNTHEGREEVMDVWSMMHANVEAGGEKNYLEAYGLRENSNQRIVYLVRAKAMLQDPGYYMFSIFSVQMQQPLPALNNLKAHAIAIINDRRATYHVFDPNYGVCRFNDLDATVKMFLAFSGQYKWADEGIKNLTQYVA